MQLYQLKEHIKLMACHLYLMTTKSYVLAAAAARSLEKCQPSNLTINVIRDWATRRTVCQRFFLPQTWLIIKKGGQLFPWYWFILVKFGYVHKWYPILGGRGSHKNRTSFMDLPFAWKYFKFCITSFNIFWPIWIRRLHWRVDENLEFIFREIWVGEPLIVCM